MKGVVEYSRKGPDFKKIITFNIQQMNAKTDTCMYKQNIQGLLKKL